MTDGIGTPQDFMQFDRGGLSPILVSLTVSGAGALVLSALVGALIFHARTPAVPSVDAALAVAPAAKLAPKIRNVYGALAAAPLAPVAANSPNVYGRLVAVSAAPVAANNPNVYGTLVALPAAPSPAPASTEAENAPPPPVPTDSQDVQNVPLPPPRPLGGGLFASHVPLRASRRHMAEEESTSVPATAPSDHRNFFEKMFGIKSSAQPGGQTLAYASPEDGISVDGRRPSAAVLPYGQGTAVYDISAHTVYMPDGTRLEAHSGLGSRLDDPRHVNEKMRGATPPHVYALEPRAQLFHGIQALRLIPVGGDSGLFGRTGLLAHSYMLGQKGASFGCVSFKNYNAFLEAYKKGEVKRLVVVAGLN